MEIMCFGNENMENWPRANTSSYDIANCFPAVPINKAIDIIIRKLNKNYDDLRLSITNGQ